MEFNPRSQNILFFDGVCHLCNGYIDFLVRINPAANIFYSPLQGRTAQTILPIEHSQNLNTMIYFKNGKIFNKSNAVLESLADVSSWYLFLKISYVVPKFIRDFFYDVVANNRYRWFGKAESCRIPTDLERKYILD